MPDADLVVLGSGCNELRVLLAGASAVVVDFVDAILMDIVSTQFTLALQHSISEVMKLMVEVRAVVRSQAPTRGGAKFETSTSSQDEVSNVNFDFCFICISHNDI